MICFLTFKLCWFFTGLTGVRLLWLYLSVWRDKNQSDERVLRQIRRSAQTAFVRIPPKTDSSLETALFLQYLFYFLPIDAPVLFVFFCLRLDAAAKYVFVQH
jgi:hypothetical protein